MDAEALYRQVGQLVADTPADLFGAGPISPDTHLWLGRIAALLPHTGSGSDVMLMSDRATLSIAIDGLADVLRAGNAHKIVAVLYRALARAELAAPPSVQGAFIPVGSAFTLLQVVKKILSSAKADAFIVDAYMGVNMLTDFVPLAPENVSVRLLSDSGFTKAETLRPAATAWARQYGKARPLETRFTAPRLLHDRLIVVDGAKVWSLTQSLKDFAARSPGSLLRVEKEIADQKIHAYEQFWESGTPLN